MTIKAIAWDIDGTLVNSEPLHLEALKYTCEHFYVDIADLADNHFVGINVLDVWAELKPRFPTELTYEGWQTPGRDYYHKQKHTLQEIDGAIAVLGELKNRGLMQVAVSNSERRIVTENLTAIGADAILEFSISLDDVGHPKPHPFPYQTAVKRLGFAPDEVIAIEDSPTGLKSAKSAGLHTIGLLSNEWPTLDADYTITRLLQIVDVVDSLRNNNT